MNRQPRVFSHSMRRSIGQAAISGVLTYASASFSAGFLVLVGGGSLAAWLLCPASGRVAPRRAINAGLLAVVGFGVFQSLRIGISVEAFAYFIGLLLVVKLLDLRRASDWGQTLTLSTALVIAGALTSNSLLTGITLFVSTLVILRAVLRFQIYAAQERSGVSVVTASTVLFRRSLRRMQWGITALTLLAGTLVFMFLPRELGTEAFGRWQSAAVGQSTGFADEVELGRPGLISQSPTPVMDVEVVDREGRNLGAVDAQPIYLRGAVLEDYESGRWVRSRRAERASFRQAKFIPAEVPVRPWRAFDRAIWDTQLNITIRSLRTNERTPLFTAWEPLEFTPMGVGRDISYDPMIGTVAVEGSRGRMEYRVRVSDPSFRQFSIPEGATRSSFKETDIHPEIRVFAVRVLEGVGIDPSPTTRPIADDAQAVRSLQNHLQSQFTYTLEDQPTPPTRDATEWFLTERRTGHCEYFASALTMLSRSIGINARVVTGYIVSDYNEVTRQYVVRESSAHAWIEAEVAPSVWRTFDATPQEEFHQIHQPQPSFARSISNLFDTLEYAWVSTVVGYDSESRQSVFGPLASDFGLLKVAARMIRRLEAGGMGLVFRAIGAAVVVFAASMLIGLLALHRKEFIKAIWDSTRELMISFWARIRSGRKPPADRLLVTLNRTLEHAGVPKPSQVPMKAHLVQHAATLPSDAANAIQFACDLLYRHRFSPPQSYDAIVFDQAISRLRASEKTLREHTKASR
ncbi:MAG: transglutaminaseTgpA domain-containing protein [Phycisphaerales bacterium]